MTKGALARNVDAAREYFSLRATEKRAKEISEERRASIASALMLARQKREAAEVLWAAGERAEGWKLAREALRLARESAEGMPEKECVDAVAKSLDDLAEPRLDADVGGAHEKLFAETIVAYDELHRRVAPLVLDVRRLSKKRTLGAVAGAVAAIVAIVLFASLGRTPRTLRIEGKTQWSDQFPPTNAVDGRDDTEWLLPDRSPGNVDLWIGPPRPLKALKILNAFAAPYGDRGTKDFRFTVYERGGHVAKTVEGKLHRAVPPAWVEIPLETDVAIERIRFEVKSWQREGAGIAEFAVE